LSLKGHILCQLGHDHVVLAPGRQDSVNTVETAGSDGGRARVIRIGGPASPYDASYHLLARFDKIRAIVAREKPDVLEIHSPYLAALGALRVSPHHYGIRTFQWHSDFIDTYAGVLAASVAGRSGPLGPSFARVLGPATRPLWGLVRGIARRCSATLVASQWQVDKLTLHGVPRVRRVPFGIEHTIFQPSARSRQARRELLALAGRDANAETTVLVGVGRFAVEKRWDVVIDAFLRIRSDPRVQQARDAILVLFGDGPERDRMKARASHSADVIMPGFVKDRKELARMLASADALVHGCPFETFGLGIAEAMSCGVPCVVPDQGGAAEMYIPEACEKYISGDASACALAVLSLIDRLRTNAPAMRDAAANAARKLPSVREQFERQMALYDELTRGICRRGP